MPQTWELSLYAPIVAVTGVGDTQSVGVGSVGTPQSWPMTLNTGQSISSGFGDTISSAGDAGPIGVFMEWLDVSVLVGSSGYGDTASDSWGNVTTVAPPSATGFGNTISSGVGAATRYGGYLTGSTDGALEPQSTSGDFAAHGTTGDFSIATPLPA